MWVESEVLKGSKFFFTISSQISISPMEAVLSKMAPFSKRTILFVDTLGDTTKVDDVLGLKPHVVHSVADVVDNDKCPHVDMIVVDTLNTVSGLVFGIGSRVFFSFFFFADLRVDGKCERIGTFEVYPDCTLGTQDAMIKLYINSIHSMV